MSLNLQKIVLPDCAIKKFWSRVARTNTCWLWEGAKNTLGYGYCRIGEHIIRVHRLAFFLSNGFIDDNLFVCHRCDNRACVNPDHLFLGTSRDNVRDMIAKGRQVWPQSKFTGVALEELRTLRQSGMSYRQLARRFNVSAPYVYRVLVGKMPRNSMLPKTRELPNADKSK